MKRTPCLEIVQSGPGHQFPDGELPIPFVAGAGRVPVVASRFIVEAIYP